MTTKFDRSRSREHIRDDTLTVTQDATGEVCHVVYQLEQVVLAICNLAETIDNVADQDEAS